MDRPPMKERRVGVIKNANAAQHRQDRIRIRRVYIATLMD
jgi:hypothetical protein